MHTRKYFYVALLIAAVHGQGQILRAQSDQTDPDQLILSDTSSLNTEYQETAPKKFDTRIGVGTSFIYSPRNYYGPSYYFAPQVSYLITPRFNLSAGLGVEYSTLYPLDGGDENQEMLPMVRAYLYARGAYLLSPKLTLSGTVYKSVNDVPRLAYHNHRINYSYSGFNVGVHYQLSRSFSVGFQMQMNSGVYPGYNSLIPVDAYVPLRGF
jgi:hypothetical protein